MSMYVLLFRKFKLVKVFLKPLTFTNLRQNFHFTIYNESLFRIKKN